MAERLGRAQLLATHASIDGATAEAFRAALAGAAEARPAARAARPPLPGAGLPLTP